ncbi:MAG: hypothetical protein VKJ06_04755 [Vampirovibrionales bacterium]|nr:hypothetical protein [Vampirovibrionales bacterium]
MMDAFRLIQGFFARMTCNECSQRFEPSGIELIREEDGMFVVSVYCHKCQKQVGVAMVGVESRSIKGDMKPDFRHLQDLNDEELEDLAEQLAEEHASDAAGFAFATDALTGYKNASKFARYAAQDPELTPTERRRLASFKPVSPDDVLDAHHFFQSLDAGWSKLLANTPAAKNEASDTLIS